MNVYQAIRKRKMVRAYANLPVDPAAIDRIVDAGLTAPSAGFAQGQAFVVITDQERRHQLATLASEPEYRARGFEPWLSRAPVHIVVCVSPDAYRERYQRPDKSPGMPLEDWPVPYWWVDGGASLMAMLLAAVEEGLSAGFLGAHSLPGLASTLDIPDEYLPVGLVTIGHGLPNRPSLSSRAGRKLRSETVRYGSWS